MTGDTFKERRQLLIVITGIDEQLLEQGGHAG